ncbi:MAG: hypothetical protein CMJ49_02505 [Planctomycetaceae bacterium]|nr:hypothetical protein [Planctomycetaceae bacterium]
MSSRLMPVLVIALIAAVAVNTYVNYRVVALLEQVSLRLADPPQPVVVIESPIVETAAAGDSAKIEPVVEPVVEPAVEPVAQTQPSVQITITERSEIPEPPRPELVAPQPPALSEAELHAKAWETSGPIVTGIIKELLAGDYDDAAARLDDVYAARLGTKLNTRMDDVRQESGEFSKVIQVDKAGVRLPGQLWRVVVETNRDQRLQFTIQLNDAKKVSSVYVFAPKSTR